MKVLIGLDDSTQSEQMLNSVVKRKWPEDTQFDIVSVIEPIDAGFEEKSWLQLADEVHKRRKERAENMCQEARQKIEKSVPHAKVYFEVKDGDPCCQLIQTAVDRGVDKIVLGAHSRAVCPHNLLGSTSRAVSLHAPCSVEVIRENGHASKN